MYSIAEIGALSDMPAIAAMSAVAILQRLAVATVFTGRRRAIGIRRITPRLPITIRRPILCGRILARAMIEDIMTEETMTGGAIIADLMTGGRGAIHPVNGDKIVAVANRY